MGLDMYLKCNSRELTEYVFGKRVEWGYEQPYSFHRRRGIVCYWRKANAIHGWFVQNVQGGEDDCGIYTVELGQLAELRDACKNVLERSELTLGDGDCLEMVAESHGFDDDGRLYPRFEARTFIRDPSAAKETLPTQEGFFFGSQEYGKLYLKDIEETCRTLDLILSIWEKDGNGNYPFDPTYGDSDWAVEFTYQASW